MELLDAADKVIRRQGPAASMEVIAAEAGITKPILYRHFDDKGGLYTALAERYSNALMSEIKDSLERAGHPRRRLALTIDTYFSWLESEPQVYRFLVHRAQTEQREVHEAIGAFVSAVALEVAAIARLELGGDDQDEESKGTTKAAFAEPLAFAVVGAVQTTGDWWLEHREMPRTQLVEELVTLIWDGFERYAGRSSRGARNPSREGVAS
ncbi:MAG: TetR family transcriptional regulator [Actinomycetota bacterium]